MKLKKIVSLGLISTLSLSILSGCSKKEGCFRRIVIVVTAVIATCFLFLKISRAKYLNPHSSSCFAGYSFANDA